MSVDIANEKVISIQLAPFEILKQDGNIFVETQQHGPDKNTDGWGVYKRYSRGMVIHVIDAKTEEDGKLLAGKVAEENGVEVEPYPWLVEKASKNVESNRIMFPTSMESQVEKQTAYLNTLRDLVLRAFKDGVVLGIDSPENPTKDPMPENYKVYMQVGPVAYQEDKLLELPLNVRTTTIARISADKPDGSGDFNKHYLGQYIPNPVGNIPDYQRDYFNQWTTGPHGDPLVKLVNPEDVPEGMVDYSLTSKAFAVSIRLAELYAKRLNPEFTPEEFQKELKALVEEHPNVIGGLDISPLHYGNMIPTPVDILPLVRASQSKQMVVRPAEIDNTHPLSPWSTTGDGRKQMYVGNNLKTVVGTTSGESAFSEGAVDYSLGSKAFTASTKLADLYAKRANPDFTLEDFQKELDALIEEYPNEIGTMTYDNLDLFARLVKSTQPAGDSDEALLKDLIAKTKERQAVVANDLVQVLIDQVDVLKPKPIGTLEETIGTTTPLNPWLNTDDNRKKMLALKKPELPGSAEPLKSVDPLEQAIDRAIKDHDPK